MQLDCYHQSLRGRLEGFGLDPLQGLHAFTFQIAFARPRQNRLSDETMLHPKSLFDGFFQEFVFSHVHVANVTNGYPNHKLKSRRGGRPETEDGRRVRAARAAWGSRAATRTGTSRVWQFSTQAACSAARRAVKQLMRFRSLVSSLVCVLVQRRLFVFFLRSLPFVHGLTQEVFNLTVDATEFIRRPLFQLVPKFGRYAQQKRLALFVSHELMNRACQR